MVELCSRSNGSKIWETNSLTHADAGILDLKFVCGISLLRHDFLCDLDADDPAGRRVFDGVVQQV